MWTWLASAADGWTKGDLIMVGWLVFGIGYGWARVADYARRQS